jgi:hypothetical protein
MAGQLGYADFTGVEIYGGEKKDYHCVLGREIHRGGRIVSYGWK